MAQMLAEAAAAFEETLESLGISDSTSGLGDPAELGRRAALLVASEFAWRQHLGSLLDGQQVRCLLGVRTRQAVHDLVKRRRLLGLPSAEGRLVFPAIQFAPDGRPYAALPAILELFEHAAESPYTIGSWLASPQPILDGQTPAAWLRAGNDPHQVIEAARRAAARLGQ